MRSALSLVSFNQVGSDPLIKRFCRGVSILYPPRPKYDFVWNPEPVVLKLSKIYPHDDKLSLEIITRKLVLLMALATGTRVQTLSLMKISKLTFAGNTLIIRVPDRIKTSAPGRSQPIFSFSCFTERESLCIFHLVKFYLEVTENLRSKDCDNLFICFKKPHKAATTQTLSRWIKKGLEEAGVCVDQFGSHSTRHAATSLAAKKGVSVEIIKKSASWTGDSRVFANFYNRPIVNPEDFCNAVLSK